MDTPEIIPEHLVSKPEGTQLHLLFSVGITEKMQIGVWWPGSERLIQDIRNLPAAQKQLLVDTIISSVVRSLDKRIPRIINAK